jgi:hypothetical protein
MACLLSVCERKEGRKEGRKETEFLISSSTLKEVIQNERKLFQMEEKYFRKK